MLQQPELGGGRGWRKKQRLYFRTRPLDLYANPAYPFHAAIAENNCALHTFVLLSGWRNKPKAEGE